MQRENRHVKARRDAKALGLQLRDDYRWLMSDARGRRLVWLWLERAGIYRTTFTGTRQGDFNEGARDTGLKLVADIHLFAPELYALMQTENRSSHVPQPPRRHDDSDTESNGQ